VGTAVTPYFVLPPTPGQQQEISFGMVTIQYYRCSQHRLFVSLFLQNSTSQNNRTDVTSHSNLTSCSAEVYLGNTCREELLSCSAHMDGDGQINIPSNGNQEKTEEQVTQLSLGLRLLNPSSECMQVAKPFLCLYMFRLCRSGEELLPSPDQCETVRSSACAVEWQRAVAILGMNQLPQCESLPGTSEELNDCLSEFKYYYCDY